MNLVTIILAAGASRRLGFPKQLVEYKGTTLLRRTAEMALEVSPKVVVVLGAYQEKIRPCLDGLSLQIVENEAWDSGMASSLQAGLRALDLNNVDAVLVLLCDQIAVSLPLLTSLINRFSEGEVQGVCAEYEGQRGVPVLFGKSLFAELMALSGEQGARLILRKYPNEITSIPFAEGRIDIDTPEDLSSLYTFSTNGSL